MSGSVNKHILIGRLGKDPESRNTSSGTAVVTFSVATSQEWKDQTTGEKRERTFWHNIVIYNENLGKVAMSYLKKGHNVYLEGEVQTRSYESNGQTKYTTETVLNNFRGTLTLIQPNPSNRPPPPDQGSYDRPSTPRDLDDEVPF